MEIACEAGTGRTETELAVLTIKSDIAPDVTIGWVREHHHPRAVETGGQRRWITEAAQLLS